MTGISVALGVIFLLILYIFAIYGGIAQKKKKCDEAWKKVADELRRRYDLTPNLVDTVGHYAPEQKQFLATVIGARNIAMATQAIKQKAEAENAFKLSLERLISLSVSHPSIKANENFVQLQEELTVAEKNITLTRSQYNDAVSKYNEALLKVYNKVVARMFSLQKMDLLELMETGQAPDQGVYT